VANASATSEVGQQKRPQEQRAIYVQLQSVPRSAEGYSTTPTIQNGIRASPKSWDHGKTTGNVPQSIKVTSPSAPAQKRTPSASPQSSDAENHPPSSRPSAVQPATSSPSKSRMMLGPLAACTPSRTRSSHSGYLITANPWKPVDIEDIFLRDSADGSNTNLSEAFHALKGDLTSPEKRMSVEEWIFWNAKNGEEKLRRECERLVSIFEKEGGRAMMSLEGIECIE